MEKKTYHNLQKNQLTRLMIGFCYVTGIMLAAFTYGNEKLIIEKRRTDFNIRDVYVVDAESPKEIVTAVPQVQASAQEKPVLDLTQEIKPDENEQVICVTDEPSDTDNNNEADTTNNSASNDIPVIMGDTEIKDFPDVEAEFEGGYDAWKSFLLDELIYPEISIEFNEQGTVYISFVIEQDGSIGEVKVLRGVSRLLDEEAIRVIKKSPKWKPGLINNQPVRTRISIPINFILQ